MRKKEQLFLYAIGIVTMICGIGQKASADAIPPAFLYLAEQKAQDVKLGVKISETDGNFTLPREIIRVQGDAATPVVSNIILADETPTSSEPVCGDFYYESIDLEEFCTTYPDACSECDGDTTTTCIGESCDSCIERSGPTFYPGDSPDYDRFCDLYPTYGVDCDGDGKNECCFVCEFFLYYDFWDRCVPPGATDYEFHDDSTWDEYSMSGISQFEVTEYDISCLDAPSTDETASTDSETSISSDEPISISTDSETSVSTDAPASTDEPSSPNVSGGGGCSTAGFFKTASSLSILHLLAN